MLRSRRGVQCTPFCASVARSALLVAALALAGCASDGEYRREAYAREAQAMNSSIAAQRVGEPELEDDGLPGQVPPPLDRRREPDDPREPYSPNYGQKRQG